MRILHLRTSGGVYGAERVILALAAEQRRQGHDAAVLCLDPPGASAFAQALRASGVPARHLAVPGGADPGAALALLAAVRDASPEVLHSHGYKTDVLLAALRPLAGRPPLPPLVATNHNWTGATRALRVYERLDALALRAFARVAAVSRASRAEMLARGLRPERVAVVPNGIALPMVAPDRARARAALARLVPDPGPSPIVGYVGRLSAEKGVRELADALGSPLLAQARAVLVGDGPLRGEVEAALVARGLAARAHLVGWRDDAAALLPAFDVLVLPSWREGVPLAALEAFAAGVPVVASRVGGMPDVVRDGETGL
ncbi:MAG TPA: glycosyltransferase, partial [Anaeromyxobacteraceae bacterium]|nr:glycosyltransferase [Anaeromyxobacteraceae bacterium]